MSARLPIAPDQDDMLVQLPAYLSLIDTRGRLYWCNRTGYGIQREDIIHEASDARLVEEDRPKWRAWLHRVIHGRETIRYSVRYQAPPGVLRLVGKLAPVVISGEVRWVVCLTYDATYVDPTPCEGCAMACRPLSEAAAAEPARRGRWLSPLEERLLKVLKEGVWVTGQKIADAAGETLTDATKAILANLVERGILESAPGRGYRLARD